MILQYNTRDAEGNDFIKDVEIKEFPHVYGNFECAICHKHVNEAVMTRQVVSSNFTDWEHVGDFACINCSQFFSLFPYSFISDTDGIRLFNVREIRDQLITPQKPPFMVCLAVSKKKHIFYRAIWNSCAENFAVQLETERIFTSPQRMQKLFDFVECLQTLGNAKDALRAGRLTYDTFSKVSKTALVYLQYELNASREIQIPLFCGQKRNISEEECICIINSILTA